MEKLKNNYSFRLQTQYVGTVLMEVCSLSLMCQIPLEFKNIVITGSAEDHISFQLFMNKPTKDMVVRIFFQLPGVNRVQILDGRIWQSLENPFSWHVDEHNYNQRNDQQNLN